MLTTILRTAPKRLVTHNPLAFRAISSVPRFRPIRRPQFGPPQLRSSRDSTNRLKLKCREWIPVHHRTLTSKSDTLPPTSFPDPDRPDLFYHLCAPPTPLSSTSPVFAVSLLSEPPVFAESKTVLGWLPAEASGEEGEAGLNDFVQNPGFLDLLHEAIQSGLRDGVDEIQKNGATQTQQGWMHIHDERNVPALGRIGDPDDILASVRVEEGVILADTYQPMPSYRLCTSDGIMQLSEGLAARLKEVLEKQFHAEKSA